MGNLRADFLFHKVRVHYSLFQPDGLLDKEESIDIPYSSIPELRPFPKELLNAACFSYCEEIFVPGTDATIVFVFSSWEGREDIHGPYLKTETAVEVAGQTSGSALDTDAEASRKEKEGEESEESGEGQTPEISPDSETKSEEKSGCGIAVLLLVIAAIVVVAYYALR